MKLAGKEGRPRKGATAEGAAGREKGRGAGAAGRVGSEGLGAPGSQGDPVLTDTFIEIFHPIFVAFCCYILQHP